MSKSSDKAYCVKTSIRDIYVIAKSLSEAVQKVEMELDMCYPKAEENQVNIELTSALLVGEHVIR